MNGLNPDGMLRDRIFRRDAAARAESGGYEAARRAAMWNGRLPDRFPDIIVQAKNVYDVVAAVKLAKRERLTIGVRAGGHSWSGNHLRDGGMLLDVSALNDVQIDKDAMRATTGPGRKGHELCALLGKEDLFFPAGHCRGVGVGGYLLQGGFGRNGRALGLACMNVLAIDVVTADGELVHASPDENADLYWAARGAGPGFFGVVTRFHLQLFRKPRIAGFALHVYPLEMLEELFRWAHAIGPEVPNQVELQLVMSRRVTGSNKPGIEIFAPVFADGLRDALRALSFLNKGAAPRQTMLRVPFAPTTMGLMYRAVMSHYPDGHRYGVDNMWTHAGIDALLPGLQRIAETLPPPPSHMLWLNWAPPAERPDMAFSMEDSLYLALYGCWKDAHDDARYGTWAEDRMREMQQLASGCQLADENLGRRPARFVSDEKLARLDAIRRERDPENRFHSWMGRP